MPIWALLTVVATATAATRPNIVLVTIDTLRADHLGCYGSKLGATPTLDALAKESVRFDQAVSPVPLTRPAHTSLLTGLYPNEHGVRDNLPARLAPGVPTIATRLRAEGYDTAAFVGSFLLGRGSGLESGFATFGDGSGASGAKDVVGAAAERPAGEVVSEAISYLGSAHSPFFLWVHLYDPHAPYAPPEPFRTKYAADLYTGEIAYVDAEIGKLLKALPPSDNGTAVLVTADHGEGLGDHGEAEHGVLVYEESIHVPLLLRYPGVVAPDGVVDEPVSLVDVAPTLLSIASVPTSGPSLLAPERRPLYFESYYGKLHFGWAPLRGVREGATKLVFAPRSELFDLDSDPNELHDLSRERKDVARKLYARLQEIEARGEADAVGTALDPGDAERLLSLGYLGSTAARETGADPKDEIAKFTDFGAKLREAISRFDAGDCESARPLLEELGKRDILSFEVHLYLARCHRLEGDLEGAIREYRAASVIFDDYSPLHLEYGGALAQSGDHVGAARAFERGLEISPTARAAVGLAAARRKLGNVPGAIQALRQALALDANDADSWNELGALLLSSDDVEGAVEAFEKAVALRPEDELLRHNLEFARGIKSRR